MKRQLEIFEKPSRFLDRLNMPSGYRLVCNSSLFGTALKLNTVFINKLLK